MEKTLWIVSLLSIAIFGTQSVESQPSSEREAIPVKVVTVEERAIRPQIAVSGIVRPKEQVKLSFRLGGEVVELPFDEGDRVNRGDVLARLDRTEIQARARQARVGLDKAQRDLERARKLYEEETATLQQFQDATSAFEKAEADLVIAEHNLTHLEIQAPFSGRIAFRFVQERELIPPGTPALVLVDIQEVKVEVGVSDSDIGKIRREDRADIRVDAYPSETFVGRVARKAIAADPTSGTFKVEIAVENRDERLLPGMIAQATMHIQPHTGMFVPMEALSRGSGGKGALFVTDPTMDRVHRREVTIGAVVGDQVEVFGGIEPGDKVVAGGSTYLKDGDSVRIVE